MNEAVKHTILVTGGTGYIGSHTAVALLQQGYDVVIADNLCNSSIRILDRVEQITGTRPRFYPLDVCDAAALDGLWKNEPGIEAVIHFAALKAVGESVEKPLLYYRNNVASLVHLLEAQVKFGAPLLVFSSSCTVYGEPDTLPVTEESPIKPAISPYGNTKQIGEQIIRDATHTGKVRSIALRYFNPVGAHHSGLIGELPIGKPNNLVPFITQTAIGKHSELVVFGDDYPTPDGTCIRDFIHVEDVAAAHVAAVDRLLHGVQEDAFEVFNIGTGTGYSVLEAIRAFERASGRKLPYRISARRPGDIVSVFADTQRSNRVLGWKAQKNLDDMMGSAWAWEQSLSKDPLL